jgi:hypothetical protein
MFKKRYPSVSIAAAFLMLAAGLAVGQSADKNTSGPTKNDFRLRIVEPLENATVVGPSVRVIVSNSVPRTTQETTGTSNMPNPSFRVYLGNTLKGQIKRDDNVLVIDNVAVGSQRLVVEALNTSGELIDRKEIRFQTVAQTPVAASPLAPPADAQPAIEAPPAAAPQVAPPSEPIATRAADTTFEPREIPQTASDAPRAAVAGFALMLVGLLLWTKPVA